MNNLFEIIKNFKIEGDVKSITPYGSGHINQTFLVESYVKGNLKRYILQKINHNLFTEVDKLMNNIRLVTEYNRKITAKRGNDPDSECLSLVYTLNNESYYYDGQGYYRVYIYIENSVYYNIVEDPKHFYESAISFGNFASILSTFDATQLYEVLPDFHNTVNRFQNFKNAVEKNVMKRAEEVQEEIDFIYKREKECSRIVELLESGEIPLKVTHNDTKLNNVLFNKDTNKGLAVIDFDTIMPGSICYDFGDSIRFGCNPALEDEKVLSKVNFRIDLFEEYVKGFLYSLGDSITETEKDNLSMGAILMTLECGMRFLTDYLEGDTYFKTTRAGQNLDRTRTQLKLVSDMEQVYDEMNKIVNKYYSLYCKR